MWTDIDLLSVSGKPTLKDISLQLLAQFYEDHICTYTYYYDLEDESQIQLNFYSQYLSHLLGIQHIVPKKLQYKYKGHAGYKKIRDGSLTFQGLNSMDSDAFNLYKDRMLYFPYIYQLLRNPDAIKFDKSKIPKCNINCEIIFYNIYLNTYVHLGINTESDGYFPVTFLIDPRSSRFVPNQEAIKIKNISIKPILSAGVNQAAITKEPH